ncbi:MAG: hypothetical protein HUJ98_02640 [Bacteroidaceae bacterium]|nr:hypothetical protein [Bacteroidaceae bacterium]
MGVYNLDTKKDSTFFRRGRGPGEMLGLWDFCLLKEDAQIALSDITAKRIYTVPLKDLEEGTIHIENIRALNENFSYDVDFISGDEHHLCISGFFEHHRTKIANWITDFDSLEIKEISWSPDVKKHSELDRTLNIAYQASIACADNYTVLACIYADQLEIVDNNTESVTIVKGPESFEPAYTVVNSEYGPVVIHDKDAKHGYIKVRCDKERIFALYSGEVKMSSGVTTSSEIRVFDWSGKALKKLILDTRVSSFDIDPKSSSLYALTSTGEVIRYSIPF